MLGWLRRNGSNGALERGVDLIEAAPTVAQRQDELLSGYLDNDLAPAVREELEVRLATEADLRESLAGMRLVRDTLRTLEPVRAPRSFAIAAPPVRAPQRGFARGFGRLDLAARFGAMAAVVAFVVVLAGDLSGGDTPISDQSFSAALEAPVGSTGGGAADAAGGAGGGAAERAASDAGAAVTVEPTTESLNTAAAAAAPAPAEATASASAMPLEESTVAAAGADAAVSELEATTEAAAAPAEDAGAGAAVAPESAGGSEAEAPSAPPAAGGTGDQDAEPSRAASDSDAAAPADDEGGAGAATEATAGSDGDDARVESAAGTGTSDRQPSLVPQPGDAPAPAPELAAIAPLTEAEREVSVLAIGLGAAAAAMAAAAGLLWWRRRDGATGPI